MAEHGVRIFGKRPPSPKREYIPWSDIKSLIFRDGATRLFRKHSDQPEFVELEVHRTELEKHRQELLDASGGER